VDQQAIVVDSGNLLFKRLGAGSATPAEKITAEAIASAYAEMGYDGVGIGPRDLTGGIDLLLKTRDLGVPWLSANMYDKSGNRIFEPYRLVDRGQLRFAVTAVTFAEQKSDDYTIGDAVQELGSFLPELDTQADIIILLSTLPLQQTAQLLQQASQIDIAVTADRSRGKVMPYHAGNAIIVQTGTRGQYAGALDFMWRGQPWMNNRSTETAALKRRLRSVSMQLKQVKNLPPEPRAEKTEMLQQQHENISAQIQELETAAAREISGDLSRYRCNFIPLSPSIRSDPAIDEIVESAKKLIRQSK